MALCESSNRRITRPKALWKFVAFISANVTGAVGTNRKALKPSRTITKNPEFGTLTTASCLCKTVPIVRVNLEESTCVIMKCSSVVPGMAH